MKTSSLNWKRAHPWLTALMLLGTVGAMSACSGESRADLPANASRGASKEVIYAGGVRGLNYSPDYIHSFSVSGPRGMEGGGGNMIRAGKDGPGEAGERCCIGIPQPWQPDTKLEIEWELDRSPYDGDIQNGLEAMRATVTVPPYGPETYGFWAIFLPGDRGARQGSCRLIHAAKRCFSAPSLILLGTAISRSGLSVTVSIGDQSRVSHVQRRGLRSRA
ncbi:DUF3304 domain-containing protein [Cupriavidus sp. SK-4]|uniref:DUF3304 domain-containing protein n=1 Tax=Cupriavidus sp. SK-4 TaxID=574750 RepID=UPI001F251702|nr:DUF3304 domain-containing protein [Cupriavidus sp. SK-4]